MLIKFFRTGRGVGKGPTDYCCNSQVPTVISVSNPATGRLKAQLLRNESGKPVMKTRRPPPEILSGDRVMTRELIDSLNYKWKYSSGVIAFAPTDCPTEEQQAQLMAEFEALAFVGLDRDRYDILWIRHSHEGVPELHFVIPRVELATGKSYNPAPPGWQRSFSTLRDAWNFECGWADPNDPARARVVQAGHINLQHAENIRAGLADAEEPKVMITDYLVACIEAGFAQNRQGLVVKLEELGMSINRQGKDYISVRMRPDTKPIRLKGSIYAHDFNATEFLSSKSVKQNKHSSPVSSLINTEQAANARRNYAAEIAKRAAYNSKRYIDSSCLIDKYFGDEVAKDLEPQSSQGAYLADQLTQSPLESTALATSDQQSTEVDKSGFLDSEPGPEHPVPNIKIAGKIKPASIKSETDQANKSRAIVQQNDFRVLDNQEHLSIIHFNEWDPEFLSPLNQSIWQTIRDSYDRVRTAITQSINGVISAIREGHEKARKAEQHAQRTSHMLVATSSAFEQSHREINQITIVSIDSYAPANTPSDVTSFSELLR